MEGSKRIQVLARQLTSAAISCPSATSVSANDVDVQRLAAFLLHDNPQLRAQIQDFLKVAAHAHAI